ncbi:transposase [Kitasatospora sp. NPDC094011]|uniref:transposase n=1 Tax=Kitasatospora sp. NPDC094011 TaxID=3364090 RepID=UPI0037F43D88
MTSTNPSAADSAPRPKRRTFSPEYKLRIVAEYDAAPEGEKGAVLRRERLYHSHVTEWRAARDAGALGNLVDRRTSPARPKKSAAEVENEKLRRQVERLEKELARNKAALEVLGKASALLEMISEGAD